MRAAFAAECAARSAVFEAFHDLLFAARARLESTSFSALAAAAGVTDTVSFNECMALADVREAIERDTVAAGQLGIRGTPTFLINDTKITGYQGEVVMDSIIELKLGRG